MGFKKALKFFFPEWQIVQVGRKYGPFIVSDKIKKRQESIKNRSNAYRNNQDVLKESLRMGAKAEIAPHQNNITYTEEPISLQSALDELAMRKVKHLDQHSNKDENLEKVTLDTLETIKIQISSELTINLNWDSQIVKYLVAEYEESSHNIEINMYLQNKIFGFLSEYKLKKSLRDNQYIFLTLLQNKLVAQISGETIILDDFLRDKEVIR